MKIDLHNHTPLCRHATGTPMQYVEAAIAQGCHYYGFSDHAPMACDPKHRMDLLQMGTYEAMVAEAREAYRGDITVLLGYEVDFLRGHMHEEVLKRPCDYQIGSVHFLGEWGFDNPEFIGEYKHRNIDHIWQEYFDAIEAMANSGHFDIVGHLDLMKVFNYLPNKDMRFLAKDALAAIKRADMVVEINTAGLRKPIKEQYPSRVLLEEIAALNIPITFSSDAHKVDQVGFGGDEAYTLAKSLGYNKCAIFSKRERVMIIF
jgi:histidinol-phosphatase (PHP family)